MHYCNPFYINNTSKVEIFYHGLTIKKENKYSFVLAKNGLKIASFGKLKTAKQVAQILYNQ